MEKLITNPAEAKAELEIDKDGFATRAEVMNYVANFHNSQVYPSLQQANQTAFLLNSLLDYLEKDGLLPKVKGQPNPCLDRLAFGKFVRSLMPVSVPPVSPEAESKVEV